jgi:hypothetical protein
MPDAIVTGILGGLGGAVALELQDRGLSVFGVDVLDPSSAPLVHYRQRRDQLLRREGITVRSMDLRSAEFLDFVKDSPDSHLLHCAAPNPTRPRPADRELATELTLTLPQSFARFRHEQGRASGRVVLAQWTPIEVDIDPRSGHTSWEIQLEAEALAREFAAELEDVIPLPLPLLWGAGVNPWLPPLHPARELVSRIPPHLPQEEGTVAAMRVDHAAKLLVELALNEPGVTSYEDGMFTCPAPYRLLQEFGEIVTRRHIGRIGSHSVF